MADEVTFEPWELEFLKRRLRMGKMDIVQLYLEKQEQIREQFGVLNDQQIKLKAAQELGYLGEEDERAVFGELNEQESETRQQLIEKALQHQREYNYSELLVWVAEQIAVAVNKTSLGFHKINWERITRIPPHPVAIGMLEAYYDKGKEFFSRILPRYTWHQRVEELKELYNLRRAILEQDKSDNAQLLSRDPYKDTLNLIAKDITIPTSIGHNE